MILRSFYLKLYVNDSSYSLNFTKTELSIVELINIQGGAPNRNSSLEYDVVWIVGRSLRFLEDGISGRYAGKDSFVLG